MSCRLVCLKKGPNHRPTDSPPPQHNNTTTTPTGGAAPRAAQDRDFGRGGLHDQRRPAGPPPHHGGTFLSSCFVQGRFFPLCVYMCVCRRHTLSTTHALTRTPKPPNDHHDRSTPTRRASPWRATPRARSSSPSSPAAPSSASPASPTTCVRLRFCVWLPPILTVVIHVSLTYSACDCYDNHTRTHPLSLPSLLDKHTHMVMNTGAPGPPAPDLRAGGRGLHRRRARGRHLLRRGEVT